MPGDFTFSLSVVERLALLNLTLPQRGGYLTMLHVDEMRKRLQLTSDEIAALGNPDGDGDVRQPNFAAVGDKQCHFSKADLTIISGALTNLDKKNDLAAEQVSLYNKFVSQTFDTNQGTEDARLNT